MVGLRYLLQEYAGSGLDEGEASGLPGSLRLNLLGRVMSSDKEER